MRKLLILFVLFVFSASVAFCDVIQGEVTRQGYGKTNQVIDSGSNSPVDGAKVSIPQKNYKTYTDEYGRFQLDTKVDGQTVMSVEKPGYKPFSVTIDEKSSSKPIVLGIEKSTPQDITIDTDMFHLGDNNFSDNSANAKEFRVKSIGPYYSKDFKIPNFDLSSSAVLIIGSIIGVDTKIAKAMGQNKVAGSYSSPPEVYFNGSKIAEIQLNGDGQKIKIPRNLIRLNQMNEVTIKTGKNLMQTSYVDYDDIEFMNLSIETK